VGCLLALGGLLFFVTTAGVSTGRPIRVALWLSLVTPIFLTAHLVAWSINASPEHRLDAAWLASSLESTVGRVELWRTGLSLLPLWALGLARRPRLALTLALPAILISSAVGHSAAIRPALAVPLKALHLLAVAVWIGGLLWLLVRERGASSSASEIGLVSNAALWAVIVVALSGLVQTLMLISSIDGIASPYGAVVVAKIVGLVLLIGFGAYHRRRIIPRLGSDDGASIARLQTSVAREVVVFSAVILLGGLLAYLSPPADRAGATQSLSSEPVR
jgi:putative copper export protein